MEQLFSFLDKSLSQKQSLCHLHFVTNKCNQGNEESYKLLTLNRTPKST